MDYFSHTKNAGLMLERLASKNPQLSRACTAARGVGTGQNCFVLLLMRYLPYSLPTWHGHVAQPGAPSGNADKPRR